MKDWFFQKMKLKDCYLLYEIAHLTTQYKNGVLVVEREEN